MFSNKRHSKSLLLAIVLATCLSSPLFTVSGAQTGWISLVSIQDKTSNTSVAIGKPLLAGHSYNITIQVDVPFTQSGSNFDLVLDDSITASGTQYWYLLTKNYLGYNSTTFKPGEKSIRFTQVEGKIQLAVIFSVPATITVKQSLGETYRFMQEDFPLLRVLVTGGSTVGVQSLNISDASIETYLTTVNQKSNLVPSGQIDKSYDSLVKGILTQADVIYRLGQPEKATDILNIVSTSNFPAPPSNSLQTLLIGAVAVIAVAAVVGFLLFSRANSKASMKASAIDDTRNELASLEVTAARYDESLASQLKRLRDKLEA
ncbi:MAG: hypothetical protein NTY03_00755 [Candidatus Bathyarchaeota archaeon]|nr:hypothetical protein [Candidatus Bathyarchaeota archaeon]